MSQLRTTTADRRPALAVLGAAVGFGSTFALVRAALLVMGPYPFVAMRFLLAALILWAIAWKRPKSPGTWKAGFWPGIWLLAGYVLQTIGLQYVTGPVSAFLTYMLVVFVPVMTAVVARRWPPWATFIAVAVSILGLWAMSGASVAFGAGELFTLGCAFAFAANIVALSRVAAQHDVVRLTAVQMTIVGFGALGPAVADGRWSVSPLALIAVLATAILASVIGFLLQIWGQQHMVADRVAVLLMVEPVVAAAMGAALGVHFSGIQMIGAALILIAVGVSELAPQQRQAGLN